MPGVVLSCLSASWNSVRTSSFASRLFRHQRSSASNRRCASSSRTTFTVCSIPRQVFPCVNSTTCLGVPQCAIEGRGQLCALFLGQLVVNQQNFDLRAFGQVRRFVQNQPSVLHLNLA